MSKAIAIVGLPGSGKILYNWKLFVIFVDYY